MDIPTEDECKNIAAAVIERIPKDYRNPQNSYRVSHGMVRVVIEEYLRTLANK